MARQELLPSVGHRGLNYVHLGKRIRTVYTYLKIYSQHSFTQINKFELLLVDISQKFLHSKFEDYPFGLLRN